MAGLAGQRLPDGFDHPVQPCTFVARPGHHALGLMVGVEFGQMHAETLAKLADCAVRITPWRMILLEGASQVQSPGLITDPTDPRLQITACTGAPGCSQSLQPTRDLARRLAAQVPMGQHLHVSGCAKGCAHPKAAAVTLVGTATGFDLIRNGRAGDAGVAFDATTSLFKVL